MKEKIKVLIIDDSSSVRRLLSNILSREVDMDVVGEAADPIEAMPMIESFSPDVITLDVNMPRMDGVAFLTKLMGERPLPVVMVSSLTQHGSEQAIRCLELGAVEVVGKSSSDRIVCVDEFSREIVSKVRSASCARRPQLGRTGIRPASTAKPHADLLPPVTALAETRDKIIAIGASTGGVEAIKKVITRFPKTMPGTVVVQHMPPLFTKAFAKTLNDASQVKVKEAEDGDRVLRGTVLIAPGDRHMSVTRHAGDYLVELSDGPPVHYVRPAVDVLFRSVARSAGKNGVGALLTGMGEDGAEGLLAMLKAGAFTIAQDEGSSVVYGMPRKAAEIGAAKQVAELGKIADIILENI